MSQPLILKSWSWAVLWRPNAKVGSQEILVVSLVWLWSTKWSRAKTNRILPREHTGHSKHPFPTTQEKTLHTDITRWSTTKSDWLCSLQPKMEKLYIVSKNKTRSWQWLGLWTPYCQIVRKITRPFSLLAKWLVPAQLFDYCLLKHVISAW